MLTEFLFFNQRGDISTLNGRSMKPVDKLKEIQDKKSYQKPETTKESTKNTHLFYIWLNNNTRSYKIKYIRCKIADIIKEGKPNAFENPKTTFIMNKDLNCGGARGVIVIVLGNKHGDTSSNPGRD